MWSIIKSRTKRFITYDVLLLSKNKNFARPTVRHLVGPLAFLVNHNDDHQDEDFCQHTKERPEWGQVTTYAQNRRWFLSPNDVWGAADILARVCTNVKIYNAQFCVIVLVHDEEASSTVVNVLQHERNILQKNIRSCIQPVFPNGMVQHVTQIVWDTMTLPFSLAIACHQAVSAVWASLELYLIPLLQGTMVIRITFLTSHLV